MDLQRQRADSLLPGVQVGTAAAASAAATALISILFIMVIIVVVIMRLPHFPLVEANSSIVFASSSSAMDLFRPAPLGRTNLAVARQIFFFPPSQICISPRVQQTDGVCR